MAEDPTLASTQKQLFCSSRRLTEDDIVEFPASFTPIQENQWGNIPRLYESLDDVTVCDGSHAGLCNGEHCIGFECMIECIQHRHGYDCKGMNFRRSVGARLGLYRVGLEYGVFSIDGAEKDTFMCEFLGNVVWDTDIDKDNAYYVMLDGELLLDASKCGGIAGFINHSCSPNCSLQVWWVPAGTKYEPRVGIFALRDLNPGEPLTFAYRMASVVTNTIVCHCGSKSCKKYVNTERKRTPFRRITRHKTNAVLMRTNAAASERDQTLERLHAFGPNGEYDVHITTLCENVKLFQGLNADAPGADYVSMLNQALQLHDRKLCKEVETGPAVVDPKTQIVSMTVKVCGVPFTATAKNARSCKQACFRRAIQVFQTIKPSAGIRNNQQAIVPRSVVVRELPTSAPLKDIKVVVQGLWTIAKQYRMDAEQLYQRHVNTEELSALEKTEAKTKQRAELAMLQKVMLMSANEFFPVPQHFMKYLDVTSFKIHDIVDPAAVLLSTRMKLAEIGSPARMKCVYHNILAVKNATYGTHLVLLNTLINTVTVDEMLEKLDVSLPDVVDKDTFETQTGEALTTDTFYKRVTTVIQRSARSRIYGARIRSVVWPMQTISEFYEALGLFEAQLARTVSKDCVRQMRAQIQGDVVQKTIGVHMNVQANGDNWSSMVIATQMNLTESQYAEQVQVCHRYREQMIRSGYAWMTLDQDDCNQIREIVQQWTRLVNDELLHSSATKGHRNIGSWVDEYAMYPGGVGAARNAALVKFLKGLCRIGFTEGDVLKKMTEKPVQGLSPIALTESGSCFRGMELLLVLSAELRTQNRSLTVAAHTALGAHYGTSRQPPHLDDQRLTTLIAALPMNLPNEGPFQATLVPKIDLNFEQLYSDSAIPRNSETFSETFLAAYKPLIDKLPDEFLASMQPAVEAFENSGMIVTLGNQLHCGPGNTLPGASGIRLVTFAATGIEGSHYDGKQQLMWDQLIEQMHGLLSFWTLLHIVEFSLCDGIHVWEHYAFVSLPIKAATWTRSKLTPWSRSRFLESLVASVRALCSPLKLDLCEWPLAGQPVRSRKRVLAGGEPKYEFGKARYSRLQVRRAMVVMWRYMTVNDEGAQSVIENFFDTIEVTIPLKNWKPWAEFQILRAVYQLMFETPEDQKRARSSFGYTAVRRSSKEAIVGITWSDMTAEMEATVGHTLEPADQKVAAAQREGLVLNTFVIFQHEGMEKRGIICGYDQAGNIEVCVAVPEIVEVVVDKTRLRIVNP